MADPLQAIQSMWELPSTALLLWAMSPYVKLCPFRLEDLEVRDRSDAVARVTPRLPLTRGSRGVIHLYL